MKIRLTRHASFDRLPERAPGLVEEAIIHRLEYELARVGGRIENGGWQQDKATKAWMIPLHGTPVMACILGDGKVVSLLPRAEVLDDEIRVEKLDFPYPVYVTPSAERGACSLRVLSTDRNVRATLTEMFEGWNLKFLGASCRQSHLEIWRISGRRRGHRWFFVIDPRPYENVVPALIHVSNSLIRHSTSSLR